MSENILQISRKTTRRFIQFCSSRTSIQTSLQFWPFGQARASFFVQAWQMQILLKLGGSKWLPSPTETVCSWYNTLYCRIIVLDISYHKPSIANIFLTQYNTILLYSPTILEYIRYIIYHKLSIASIFLTLFLVKDSSRSHSMSKSWCIFTPPLRCLDG
jgi:hypothetical protein